MLCRCPRGACVFSDADCVYDNVSLCMCIRMTEEGWLVMIRKYIQHCCCTWACVPQTTPHDKRFDRALGLYQEGLCPTNDPL